MSKFVWGMLLAVVMTAIIIVGARFGSSAAHTHGVPVESVTKDGKIDVDGTLVFENREGQCIRMWQMEHRMEAWLMGQKDIRVENMYSVLVPQEHPWQYRFYVRYQMLGEVKK